METIIAEKRRSERLRARRGIRPLGVGVDYRNDFVDPDDYVALTYLDQDWSGGRVESRKVCDLSKAVPGESSCLGLGTEMVEDPGEGTSQSKWSAVIVRLEGLPERTLVDYDVPSRCVPSSDTVSADGVMSMETEQELSLASLEISEASNTASESETTVSHDASNQVACTSGVSLSSSAMTTVTATVAGSCKSTLVWNVPTCSMSVGVPRSIGSMSDDSQRDRRSKRPRENATPGRAHQRAVLPKPRRTGPSSRACARSRREKNARRATRISSNVSSNRFTLEELDDYCRRVDRAGIERYVTLHRGHRVPMSFPRASYMITGWPVGNDGFSIQDLQRCECEFLGRRETLSLVGYFDVNADRYSILSGERGMIYVYDPYDDCMYLVGNTLTDTVNGGTSRVESVSPHLRSSPANRLEINTRCRITERQRFLRSRNDFEELLSAKDARERAAYVKRQLGRPLALAWPPDHVLVLTDVVSAGFSGGGLTRLTDNVRFPEPLGLLGIVGEGGSEVFFRGLSILTGDSGRVFCNVLGSENVTEIAESLETFVRVGLARLVNLYRYERIGGVGTTYADAWPERQLPPKKR